MNEIKRLLKPLDGVIILGALIISFIPPLMTRFIVQQEAESPPQAIIKINGEIIDQFDLDGVEGSEEIFYQVGPQQFNIVEVQPGKIRVKEDNSPDQIAVKTGWISQPGEISVCLPHRFMIEIRGGEASDSDPLILPHG